MRKTNGRLRALGDQLRASRVAANLTQEELGTRAGIVGKYVSEIERGTRDMPFSTLCALVEHGLGFRLELVFASKNAGNGGNSGGNGSKPHVTLPELEELAHSLAALPPELRRKALPLLRGIVELVEER